MIRGMRTFPLREDLVGVTREENEGREKVVVVVVVVVSVRLDYIPHAITLVSLTVVLKIDRKQCIICCIYYVATAQTKHHQYSIHGHHTTPDQTPLQAKDKESNKWIYSMGVIANNMLQELPVSQSRGEHREAHTHPSLEPELDSPLC